MGYTFTIGNAKPNFSKDDFPYLYSGWAVERATHPDAPTFPGDEMTGNGNERSPSYSVWSDFCKTVGLYSLFYDEYGHLRAGHPGCIGIDEEFAISVHLALIAYRGKSKLPPGFESDFCYKGPANYDYHLARLIWLDWWVHWALENCETPAIENT
jgi:hypothetical protein